MIFLFYCKVWTLDIMCETLHHLNDRHANCCKHWFFWCNFRSHFDPYMGVITAITWRISVFKHSRVESCLSRSPTKKSNGVESHDLGGQLISPRWEITRPRKVFCNKAVFAQVVLHATLSCWNHIFPRSYSSNSSKKVGYHMTITLRIDGGSRSIIVFAQSHLRTKERSKQ